MGVYIYICKVRCHFKMPKAIYIYIYMYVYAVKLLSGPSLASSGVIMCAKYGYYLGQARVTIWAKFVFTL